MRYFITLSYDGAGYHGWQIQPNGVTIEETIEKSLSTLFHQSVDIIGAGRTDTGVNASMMVAHMDLPCEIDCQQIVYRLNRMLPRDIAIHDIQRVADDMHARFSATSRTYHYYLHTQKNPFLRHYSWEVHYPLDFDRMNDASMLLLGEKDFKCFCKTGADVSSTICNVTKATWILQPQGQWMFAITANRFLRNMVRAIVGTLIDVGRDRISIDDFTRILETGTRKDAGESVPGYPLFLADIKY